MHGKSLVSDKVGGFLVSRSRIGLQNQADYDLA